MTEAARAHAEQLQELFTFPAATLQKRGDGTYLLSPGTPAREMTPRMTSRRLGVSVSTVYYLIALGAFGEVRRPSPRKILIDSTAVEAHHRASRGDNARKYFAALQGKVDAATLAELLHQNN